MTAPYKTQIQRYGPPTTESPLFWTADKGDYVLFLEHREEVRRVWEEVFEANRENYRLRAELRHVLGNGPSEGDAAVWRDRLRMAERGMRRVKENNVGLQNSNRKLRKQVKELGDEVTRLLDKLIDYQVAEAQEGRPT